VIQAQRLLSSRDADHYDGYLGMTVEMWNHENGELGQFDNPVITKGRAFFKLDLVPATVPADVLVAASFAPAYVE
jgi:hypothetical protein